MSTPDSARVAPAPVMRSDEDQVEHGYRMRDGKTIRPGEPSVCGLVRWYGPPEVGLKSPPPNVCDLCLAFWDAHPELHP